MKKIFLSLFLLSIIGCGKINYTDIEKKVNSLSKTKQKMEYITSLNGKINKDDLEKVQTLYNELAVLQEVEDTKIRVASMLPKRDGFKKGVTFSVINFFKENFEDYNAIEFLSGGNTLRLTNGLFFQDVRFKYYGTTSTMYFLIEDNSYDSSAVVKVFKNSNEFYDDYLKKNNIEIANDEVYDYYFKK